MTGMSGFWTLEPIENVAAQRVTFGQDRVVEIVGRVVGHAELFHHAAGAQVVWNREGDQAIELERVEGMIDDGARAFGGEAVAPTFGG